MKHLYKNTSCRWGQKLPCHYPRFKWSTHNALRERGSTFP